MAITTYREGHQFVSTRSPTEVDRSIVVYLLERIRLKSSGWGRWPIERQSRLLASAITSRQIDEQDVILDCLVFCPRPTSNSRLSDADRGEDGRGCTMVGELSGMGSSVSA
jgi:hypothetical protein